MEPKKIEASAETSVSSSSSKIPTTTQSSELPMLTMNHTPIQRQHLQHQSKVGALPAFISERVVQKAAKKRVDEDEDDRTSSESSISCASLPIQSERSAGSSGSTKNVRWSVIEFQSHDIVLGDHPSVEFGPPLSIGWDTVSTDRLSIDEYESLRPVRREKLDLLVPADIRHRLLMEAGYSRSEVKDCLIELAAIQESRRRNATENAPWKRLVRKLSQLRPVRKKKEVVRTFDYDE